MVHIDFQIDPGSLAEQTTENLAEEDAGVLSYHFFEFPVDPVVGGVVIFDGNRLPILYMAYNGLFAIRALPGTHRADLDLPPGGRLTLRQVGASVVVEYPYLHHTGQAPYTELLEAWETFSARVRSFLLEQFADFRDHPQLGRWFRGEEP